jgi:hypothetical protein
VATGTKAWKPRASLIWPPSNLNPRCNSPTTTRAFSTGTVVTPCSVCISPHLTASHRISPHLTTTTTLHHPSPLFTTLLRLCPCSWPRFHCRYAETLCQHAGYGASTSSAEDVAASLSDYNQKVRKAIAMFRRTENCDGVRSLMGKLPPDDTYADLLCEAFRAIEDMDLSYFNDYVDFLAPLPAQFSLGKCEGGKVLPHLIVC